MPFINPCSECSYSKFEEKDGIKVYVGCKCPMRDDRGRCNCDGAKGLEEYDQPDALALYLLTHPEAVIEALTTIRDALNKLLGSPEQ